MCVPTKLVALSLYDLSLSIGLTILPRAQLHTFLLLNWLSERRHLSPTAVSSESKVHLPSLSPLTPFLSSSSSSCYWCVCCCCCCCDKDCLNWGDTSRSSAEQTQFRTAPDPTPCSAAWLADWWSTARPPAAASANLGPEWPLDREGKPPTSTCIFLQRTVRLCACAARLTVTNIDP